MDVDLRKRRLDYELEKAEDEYYLHGKVDTSVLCDQFDGLLCNTEEFKKAIESRDTISDEDFYSILDKIAYIDNWNENDFINIVKMAYGDDYVGPKTIKTDMHILSQKNGNRCNSRGKFDWWFEEIGINYLVLYTKDTNIDTNRIYSIDELKKLIEDKKIVIVTKYERNLSDAEKNHGEKPQHFECAFTRMNRLLPFLDLSGKFYLTTLKYIKKRLTDEKLRDLFSGDVDHINFEFSKITGDGYYEGLAHEAVAKECSKRFEELGYTRRLKQLNSEVEK